LKLPKAPKNKLSAGFNTEKLSALAYKSHEFTIFYL